MSATLPIRNVHRVVGTILGTSMGDVNLDGVVSGTDVAIATTHLNQAGALVHRLGDGVVHS